MVTLPSFEDRHREYRKHTRREGGRIGRSRFWAQLSQEFETTFESNRFVPIGQLALSYGPRLGADPGVGTLPSLMGFAARGLRHIASRVERLVPARVKWEKAFRDLGLHEAPQPCNPFAHPVLGAKTCELTPDIFRAHYFFGRVHPFWSGAGRPRVLEIGAGAGMLVVLFHSNLRSQCVIVDLPEVIALSSAVVATLLPNARLLFPNEIEASKALEKQLSEYDFVFLWPDQAALIEDDSIDIAINTASFMEMTSSEVDEYFSLIQRAVKKGGVFYCCNRLEKRPGLGDNEARYFMKYPWRAQNEDLVLEVNPLIARTGGHLHIDRLQRIYK